MFITSMLSRLSSCSVVLSLRNINLTFVLTLGCDRVTCFQYPIASALYLQWRSQTKGRYGSIEQSNALLCRSRSFGKQRLFLLGSPKSKGLLIAQSLYIDYELFADRDKLILLGDFLDNSDCLSMNRKARVDCVQLIDLNEYNCPLIESLYR